MGEWEDVKDQGHLGCRPL